MFNRHPLSRINFIVAITCMDVYLKELNLLFGEKVISEIMQMGIVNCKKQSCKFNIFLNGKSFCLLNGLLS